LVVIAALYAGEVLAGAFMMYQKRHQPWLTKRLERARLALMLIRKHRRAGEDLLPAVSVHRIIRKKHSGGKARSGSGPKDPECLPPGMISNRRLLKCTAVNSFFLFESDEYGFRNPRGIWGRGRADVMAVGDSTLFGVGAAPGAGVMSLLRKDVPGSLNLGISGNGPLLELAGLKEYGPVVRPGTVFWFFSEANDLRDLADESRSPLLMRYLSGGFSQNLIGRQAEIDAFLIDYADQILSKLRRTRVRKRHKRIRWSWKLSDVLTLHHFREALGLTAKQRRLKEMRLLADVLTEARRFAGSWGGRVCFVYIPDKLRYVWPRRAAEGSRRIVLALAREAGMETIDLTTVFSGHPDPVGLYDEPKGGFHPGDEGHAVMARELVKFLNAGPEGAGL